MYWFRVPMRVLLTHSRAAPGIEFTMYSHTMITIIAAESPVLFAAVQLDDDVLSNQFNSIESNETKSMTRHQ
ncbi:hypothetical protein H9L39_12915 [Fusarium oxysporum f. sp. albedinis]|nr:hypothetical protein H9L39_12915 [Fusarium oxysporum f. sp. albedinis]